MRILKVHSAPSVTQPSEAACEKRKTRRLGGLRYGGATRSFSRHLLAAAAGTPTRLEAQLAGRKTEPNSSLGKAITYLLRHWKALTTFLREAGSPLDNDVCERALKRAVLNRKGRARWIR